ncbi:tetratricopeptide repeat protein [Pseudomonas sp. CCI3.2]|uniref:tetratricopeptide repeat protein n=1 Tax=unclassified Pseudomonas TaxID=196821 RepID=UPI002AC9C9C5|nr:MULTISPECIES: tetratricopeptide repeat protein [unclassified Pseudomonas]MEB0075536.1 tetratricopeptide repeat protein [Pseudomonas sp. MH10out]MEB0101972.1 tetratricopeptide repeat protein [Pseudomonas sp. CCI3.2]MEB0130429.1 tetratricopeptide repeat protein [Pseudomonas sp. CCI2.4]MEB0160600.1 tetratricopeptide repeat protein [Pseudomonas sp. AH2 (2023)]MEB0167347.1 tetratricopeptide repeat protein [Pseudomonas sp. CCC4.4]
MRILIVFALMASVVGCTRWSMDEHLNSAYRSYASGNCDSVMIELSQVDRESRARRYIQPEVSMLRGQCLERQKLYVDAAQTYQFIITEYPSSEYAFRARARLDTLQQLGHFHPGESAQTTPSPL